MKKSHYNEIFDLKKERKEYLLICKCKSKKFKYYTDWEEHISKCLGKLENPKDLMNFKRYLLNKERVVSRSPELSIGFISLLIPVYIDKFFVNIPPILTVIGVIIIFCFTVLQAKNVIMESYFAKDIIEIIDKIN